LAPTLTEMTALPEMTALRAHRRGGPEVLIVERAPVPAVAAGEVLVAVHAAAITFDELTWPETWTRDGVSRTPVIPSHEVSGVVTDIAPGVGDFAPGDEVYGLIRFDRDGAAADLGAEVTATVRSDAGELLRGVGAHRVRTEAFDEIGGAYDVVIDTVGGQTLDRSFDCSAGAGG
jgi:NADPH:quinone reductase-like Zn-dependent oxidoreductase